MLNLSSVLLLQLKRHEISSLVLFARYFIASATHFSIKFQSESCILDFDTRLMHSFTAESGKEAKKLRKKIIQQDL